MLGLLFNYFIAFIIATVGLLFSILAYNQKKNAFFYIGVVCITLVSIHLFGNIEYYYYALSFGEKDILIIVAAWIMSIIFLVLSKSKKKMNDNDVTDAFLDDIINSDDEDWDAES